jgi:hypothetical protein
MALVFKDRVNVTTTTTGTGTISLGSAVSGYQDFSVIGNGNTTYYAIVDPTGDWEVGIGTYSSTGPTLSRDTVLESSNSGSLVPFGAGTKNVFVTYAAEKSVILDASGNVTPLGTVSSGTWQGTAVGVGYGGTGQTSLTADNVILGNGGSAVKFVAPGVSGNVLTSDGSSWVSQAISSGGMQLIATRTLSNSAFTEYTNLSANAKYLLFFNVTITNSNEFISAYVGYGSPPIYVTSNYMNLIQTQDNTTVTNSSNLTDVYVYFQRASASTPNNGFSYISFRNNNALFNSSSGFARNRQTVISNISTPSAPTALQFRIRNGTMTGSVSLYLIN